MPKGEQVVKDVDVGDGGVNALAESEAQLVAQLSQVKSMIAQARNPYTALKLQQQAVAIEQQLKAIALALSRARVSMRQQHQNKRRFRR
jgi:fumarate hydratase class II